MRFKFLIKDKIKFLNTWTFPFASGLIVGLVFWLVTVLPVALAAGFVVELPVGRIAGETETEELVF